MGCKGKRSTNLFCEARSPLIAQAGTLLGLLLLFSTVSSPLLAAELRKPKRFGQYDTIYYAQLAFAMQVPFGRSNDFPSNNPRLGGSLAMGAFARDWLAYQVKVAVMDVPDYSSVSVTYLAEVKLYPLDIARKTRRSSWRPYLLTGVGGESITGSGPLEGTSFLFEMGAGLDWYLFNSFALFVQGAWQTTASTPTTSIWNSDQVQIDAGLTFLFQ